MKITLNIKKETFDRDGWLEEVKKVVEQEAQKAGKAFAEAALANIPVRTGFVAGAFGQLVQLVGATAQFNPIVKAVTNTLDSHRNPLNPEYYYGGGGKVLKTSTSGQQFATQPSEMFKWVDTSYVFKFDIDITYFKINDLVPGFAPSAPWGAFAAGEIAYRDTVIKGLKASLPKIGVFIKLSTLNVS